MHPSGVRFGLSRGLLQLRGGEVLLSDQLLETISAEAQRHLQLGNPPIRGNFLVDITVRAAQDALGTQHQGQREAIVSFFAHLNRDLLSDLGFGQCNGIWALTWHSTWPRAAEIATLDLKIELIR